MKDTNETTLSGMARQTRSNPELFLDIAMQLVRLVDRLHHQGSPPHSFHPDQYVVLMQGASPVIRSASSLPPPDVTPSYSNLIRESAYASPEQVGRSNRIVDERSYFYTLGVLFYELLTGELPFQADSVQDWIHAHMAQIPVPPQSPEVPPALAHLIMKLLNKLPEQRYQSAYGLLNDLNRCSDQWRDRGEIAEFELGTTDRLGRLSPPASLYEREAELEQLATSYARVCAGALETLLIGGRAGSGKTTLVREFRARIAKDKGYSLSGVFDQQVLAAPYVPLINALRQLIRQLLAESDIRLADWRERITEALGRHGALLIEMLPELALIIGEQPVVEELPPSDTTIRLHRVFIHFLRALTDHDHPMVLCLDNVQWADPASLQLLRALVNDPALPHLLVILVYRNDGFDAGQVLLDLLLVDEDSSSPNVQLMEIGELGYASVIRYVAEALNCSDDNVRPFAEALYQKTAGNPFYLWQKLQSCVDEGLLYYAVGTEEQRWEWNLQAIKEQEGFGNVIRLILAKLDTLPEPTRRLLGLASCIGGVFGLELLARLEEKDAGIVARELAPALEEGLVLASGETLSFLHDQVQQAAYERIPAGERETIHLAIGRLMHRIGDGTLGGETLFEAVHHLNLAIRLITDPVEQEQTARLNLHAGMRAKASAAFVQALELLETGAGLIRENGWSRHRELYAELLMESSECQYSCGYYDRAEAILRELLAHIGDPLQRSRIYAIQITMYAFRQQDGRAAQIAVQAMAEFGLPLPGQSSRLIIVTEMLRTRWYLTRSKVRLAHLPVSDEPLHQALANIVNISSAILYINDRELAVIMLTKYVRIALEQRQSEAFAIALASYAITLCFGFKDYQEALRLSDMALEYAQRREDGKLRGKVYFLGGLIRQLLRPEEADHYFSEAERFCMEGGDRVYTGYAVSSRLITGGADLRRLEDLCKHYMQRLYMLDDMSGRVVRLTSRYVQLLRSGMGEPGQLFSHEDFNEDGLLRDEGTTGTSQSHLYYYYTCKLEVLYLYGRYWDAAAIVEQSKHLQRPVLSFTQGHCLYAALSIMTIYEASPPYLRRNYRKLLKRLLSAMKRWSRKVPERTRAKYLILMAESDRLAGRWEAAAKRFDLAVAAARRTGSVQDEAIACERAARLYQLLNNEPMAEVYAKRTCEAYMKWGAVGVAAHLQSQFPALGRLSFIEKSQPQTSRENRSSEHVQIYRTIPDGKDDRWDMDTLRQASRMQDTYSLPADMPGAFLRLAMQNTGAERGLLLTVCEASPTIEAEQGVNYLNANGTTVEGIGYSSAVVQVVRRTRQALLLSDAGRSEYVADPYIKERQPRSILCMPLRFPDGRTVIVYLENNLIPDVFTTDRVEVLEIAFSRMTYASRWVADEAALADETATATGMKTTPDEVAERMKKLVEPLSPRELEVLRWMAEGLTNKEIAIRMGIKEGTVKIHAFNVYGKLQVNRRVQAVSRARELGLLD